MAIYTIIRTLPEESASSLSPDWYWVALSIVLVRLIGNLNRFGLNNLSLGRIPCICTFQTTYFRTRWSFVVNAHCYLT